MNNVFFDENETVVYESATASDIEKEEFFMSECITQHFCVAVSIFFDVWQRNKKIDADLKESLKSITHSNLLIPSERRDVVYDILLKGLSESTYKTCVFNLLAQFEYGCRLYLKNCCKLYPTIIKGGQTVQIDLNHILVQKGTKENKFREKIAELIGDDLTTTIEYLACRRLSGNLRNSNYHSGYGDTTKYTMDEVALFFMLLKAYCMACE